MLRSRIIPCLLVHKKGLVKTIQFKEPKYIGDPINAVKIFNEKEVDEIIVLDIDASAEKRAPDFDLIKNLANECRMPFCFGGGISSVDDAVKIISLGVEKLAINYSALNNFPLLKKIGNVVGMQSVVVVIDVRRNRNNGYDIYLLNGTRKIKKDFRTYLLELNDIGVGEIVVNSINADGTMLGYDLQLADLVRKYTDMPNTILGGCGSYEHIKTLVNRFGVIGAAAGSLFVFKGKYRAVLISYPLKHEKQNILE